MLRVEKHHGVGCGLPVSPWPTLPLYLPAVVCTYPVYSFMIHLRFSAADMYLCTIALLRHVSRTL